LLSLLISFTILALCFYYRQSTCPRLNHRLPSVMSHSYALNMVYFGYVIGTMSLVTGVVMMGAPIVGLMLLERKIVYRSLMLGMGLIVLLSLLSLKGLIPYAPLLLDHDKSGMAGSEFWFWSMVFFMIPHLLVSVLMCDLLMTTLRRRELEVRYLSERDSLTGLHNRRSMTRHLEALIQRSQGRKHLSVAVLLLDLDHFKHINDTFGHLSGDEVLVATAKVLQHSVRQNDMVGRFGGEEFVVVLDGADDAEALLIAERIRERLAALQMTAQNGQLIPIRGSIGLTCDFIYDYTTENGLIHQADQALYKAKSWGRNRVVRFRDIHHNTAERRALLF
jgi:diguanylate cyclase (GGDEF)-like protein